MKAILIIDMPHCCHDCICADWDQCLCKASNREIYSQEYMNGGRQKWCPLRPLPMKRETMVYWKSVGIGNIPTHEISEYDKGWNDCVDFLLGEDDDS